MFINQFDNNWQSIIRGKAAQFKKLGLAVEVLGIPMNLLKLAKHIL